MKSLHRSLLFAPLAVLGAACAHVPANATAAAGAAPAVAEEAESPPAVYVTGSRIKQRVDLATGLPRTTSAVVVYSEREIDATGQADLGLAYQRLTP